MLKKIESPLKETQDILNFPSMLNGCNQGALLLDRTNFTAIIKHQILLNQ